MKHVIAPLSSDWRALPGCIVNVPAVCWPSLTSLPLGTLLHPIGSRRLEGAERKGSPQGNDGRQNCHKHEPCRCVLLHTLKCFSEDSAVKLSLNQTKFSHWFTYSSGSKP